MTEQKFGWRREYLTAAHDTPNKDTSNDAPAVDQPAKQPDKTPAEVAHAPKS